MARRRRRTRGSDSRAISRRKALAIGAIGLGGLVGLERTGAFSTVVASRPFAIGVGDDETAVLGIALEDISGVDGERVDVLTLFNNTNDVFNNVDVFVVDRDTPTVDLTNFTGPGAIPAGKDRTVTARLHCENEVSDVSITIGIVVSTHTFSIEAEREVSVTCSPDADDGPGQGPPHDDDGPGQGPPGQN